MAYDLTGTILEVLEEKVISDKFKIQEFVVEVADGAYSQQIKLQATNDRIDILHGVNKGDNVKVAFNLTGRGSSKNGQTFYFTTLNAWKLENLNSSPATTSKPAAKNEKAPVMNATFLDEPSDLPF